MRPVLPSRVSQPFAEPGSYSSRDDAHGAAGHHTGIDYGSAWPIPIDRRVVRAILSGQVMRSEHDEILGNWVGVYNHRNELFVGYWHLHERQVQVGDWVLAWQPLGLVGNTGKFTTGPHLHLQVNRGRDYDYHGHIDPEEALRIVPKRREARALFRRLGGIHPEEEKS